VIFEKKEDKKMLSTMRAAIIMIVVLSVDNFGDWATPKKTPTGLFLFLSRCSCHFHFFQSKAAKLLLAAMFKQLFQ
jgi:hypothetical protein